MNTAFNDTKSTFTPFPRVEERTLVHACILTGTFVFSYSLFKWATTPAFENDVQRGAPLSKNKTLIDGDNDVLLRLA